MQRSLDEWDGDRGAILLGFSSVDPLKFYPSKEPELRVTQGFNPLQTVRFLRTSPSAPTILERLEFCYCTQRDLQTRSKNSASLEARHRRAITANPKAFNFRKDAMKRWELGIPDRKKRPQKALPPVNVTLSPNAMKRERLDTIEQIERFESKLGNATGGNGRRQRTKSRAKKSRNVPVIASTISNSKKNNSSTEYSSRRIMFNQSHDEDHQLTPRSMKRIFDFFR